MSANVVLCSGAIFDQAEAMRQAQEARVAAAAQAAGGE